MWNRKRDKDTAGAGISNTGYMTNVQNQPYAVGSVQHQSANPPDPQLLTQIAAGLATLLAALDEHRGQLEHPGEAAAFVELVAEQDLSRPDGRTTAATVLAKVRDLCSGAHELVSLVTAVLSLINTLPS